MFRGAAEERNVDLVSDARQPVVVLGDAGRLRQVVNNLIDNSLKFTPAGGRITVGWHRDAAQEQAMFSVSDSGMGISAEDLPHVFERFYRGDKSRHRGTEVSGNGLGLSICQSIVAAHGGVIRVETLSGVGSTFEICLPSPARVNPCEIESLSPTG